MVARFSKLTELAGSAQSFTVSFYETDIVSPNLQIGRKTIPSPNMEVSRGMNRNRTMILGVIALISIVLAVQAYALAAPQTNGWQQPSTGNQCGHRNGPTMMGESMMNRQGMMPYGAYQQLNQFMNGNQMGERQMQWMYQDCYP